MLKKKKYFIPIAIIAILAVAVLITFHIKPANGKFYKIKKGDLEVVVTCKGEIKGEKYTEINLPEAVCKEDLRVYQLRITDCILEGKEVKISHESGKVMVNGANVTKADIECSNGIIHVIDAVLLPD